MLFDMKKKFSMSFNLQQTFSSSAFSMVDTDLSAKFIISLDKVRFDRSAGFGW